MAATLGNAPAGTIAKIKENGVLVNFVVVAHDYPVVGRALLMRQKSYSGTKVAFSWDETNGYAGKVLDNWFESTYFGYLGPTEEPRFFHSGGIFRPR